jgi:hypothetical protein
MGTRADFYVGRGKNAEWIGSIAWDGHPDSHAKVLWRVNKESVFRSRVAKILGDKEGGPTKPEQGWPWPWEDSNTTDYAYAFDDGRVWGTCFGQGWWPIEKEPAESDDTAQVEFPDMTSRKKMAPPGSNRSGIMVIGPKQP